MYTFAYRDLHGEAFHKRRDWFLKPEWPTYVAWWVEDDHIPNRQEAYDRHLHLYDHEPSPHAFNFKQLFDEQGDPVVLDRETIENRIESNDRA